MAIIDVLKYDGPNNVLVWKWRTAGNSNREEGSIILSSTNISLINYIKNRLEELDAFVRIEEV
mgnify:CR=1 FL=1|jgi:hypothetical protein